MMQGNGDPHPAVLLTGRLQDMSDLIRAPCGEPRAPPAPPRKRPAESTNTRIYAHAPSEQALVAQGVVVQGAVKSRWREEAMAASVVLVSRRQRVVDG